MVDEVAQEQDLTQNRPQLLASTHLPRSIGEGVDFFCDLANSRPKLHGERHHLEALWEAVQEAQVKEAPLEVTERSGISAVREQLFGLFLGREHFLALIQTIGVDAVRLQRLESAAQLILVEAEASHYDRDVLRPPVVKDFYLFRRQRLSPRNRCRHLSRRFLLEQTLKHSDLVRCGGGDAFNRCVGRFRHRVFADVDFCPDCVLEAVIREGLPMELPAQWQGVRRA
mmetsp:Transcript_113810/g.321885  ORF Transcript_113810/g.321885 Transcript_113810/m.321885 type:complete len:227 (+) Transcript_113810:1095-1775(+)